MIKQLIASLVLFSSSTVLLADMPSMAATCSACHGQAGVSSNPEWPNLAGQKEGYLVDQITAFRDGTRENAQMAPMVKSLSDADIKALAAWYSAQPAGTAANGDKALVASGHNRASYCVSCHGMRGITANNEWPNLAGQQALYLENQLHAFRRGERSSGLMQNILDTIPEQDFKALAAYFSQLTR
jgi:cytochrome c553